MLHRSLSRDFTVRVSSLKTSGDRYEDNSEPVWPKTLQAGKQ